MWAGGYREKEREREKMHANFARVFTEARRGVQILARAIVRCGKRKKVCA